MTVKGLYRCATRAHCVRATSTLELCIMPSWLCLSPTGRGVGGGLHAVARATCLCLVPCVCNFYAQRTHNVRTEYAPSTHRVRTAYAPRTQCVRGAYMPCDGSLVAIIVCRQLVCTAYAPRTHRVRTAYAPRTHRVRTEYAPRTQCVRVAHIRVVGYEGGWVSGPPPPCHT